MTRKKIGVVTIARSDYGIYRHVLREIENQPDLDLYLYAGGSHLSPKFGNTIEEIREDGFEIENKVDMLLSSDEKVSISSSLGLGVMRFGQTFDKTQPDVILVLGDRFEMFSAAIAALPLNIPIGHIHGGEVTTGAMDDSIRHSITKLSHLHFVTTKEYADRVKQLGEEEWRIHLTGAPALDNLDQEGLVGKEELRNELDLELNDTILATYHPVTRGEFSKTTEEQIKEVLDALKDFDREIVFTYPNADTAHGVIMDKINQFVEENEGSRVFHNLGNELYHSLLNQVSVMVGNSSSGIIEAPSFGLPVVNIGPRQQGRVRAENVIDVPCDRDKIQESLTKSLSEEFKSSLQGHENPYYHGGAAKKIVDKLLEVDFSDKKVLQKDFIDI